MFVISLPPQQHYLFLTHFLLTFGLGEAWGMLECKLCLIYTLKEVWKNRDTKHVIQKVFTLLLKMLPLIFCQWNYKSNGPACCLERQLLSTYLQIRKLKVNWIIFFSTQNGPYLLALRCWRPGYSPSVWAVYTYKGRKREWPAYVPHGVGGGYRQGSCVWSFLGRSRFTEHQEEKGQVLGNLILLQECLRCLHKPTEKSPTLGLLWVIPIVEVRWKIILLYWNGRF